MKKFGVSDIDELDGFGRPTKKEQETIRRLVVIQIFPKRSFFANFRLCILFFGVYPIFCRIVYPCRFCPMDVDPDNCFCSHNRFALHPCKRSFFLMECIRYYLGQQRRSLFPERSWQNFGLKMEFCWIH